MSEKKSEVVVITGASAGVGRATAREFAKQGAKIGLIARGKEGLAGARGDVEREGGQAFVYIADVSDPAQVENAAQAIEENLGPIDIWVNNAMTSVFAPVQEISPEEFKRVTEVNYLGFVYGTLAALKRMRPRQRGSIVQVGSALAYRGIPLQSAYCGSKHAIQGFTDSLRAELLHDGNHIHVSMIHLAAMNTPQFGWVKNHLSNKAQPVPPIYEPEVAARAIVWAAHHDRREVFVGFSSFKAIVGNKFFPGLGDWVLARTGYQSQQTDEPRDPDQPYNLWHPVDEDRDYGPHGNFDSRARKHSWYLNWALHRRWLSAITGVGAAALAAVVMSVVRGHD
ncbi:MAG: SDR family oxidoreductase [Anaerolineae bacterium]|nr:SDR family oxidoreductase [Anaerolineae bacterium]